MPNSPNADEAKVYRPLEALDILAKGKEASDAEYAKLALKLSELPSFPRIEEEALYKLCASYPNTVNITGYSGQGVHPGQLALLERAFPAIMHDMGWHQDNTLVMSGGTAIGVPDVAIRALAQKHRYSAVGVMALPGVAYPITPGYSAICADDSWSDWGSETPAMAKGANGTILTGGGTQALTDALLGVRDGEPLAVIVNSFNAMARIPYSLGDKRGDVVMRADKAAPDDDGILSIKELYEIVSKELRASGVSETELQDLRVTGIPVSGLVTETKKGVRRQCAQDLLYFAITGNDMLLPADFKSADNASREAFRQKLVASVGLYYLLDDPSEGIFGSAVIKINDALTNQRAELLERVIEHAVQHDVSNADGIFGPPALAARSPEELASLLIKAVRERIWQQESSISA